MKPSRGCNYYRTQRYKDADALYAFKSRGFGGEVGVVPVRENKKVPRGRHGSTANDDSGRSSSGDGGLAGQLV